METAGTVWHLLWHPPPPRGHKRSSCCYCPTTATCATPIYEAPPSLKPQQLTSSLSLPAPGVLSTTPPAQLATQRADPRHPPPAHLLLNSTTRASPPPAACARGAGPTHCSRPPVCQVLRVRIGCAAAATLGWWFFPSPASIGRPVHTQPTQPSSWCLAQPAHSRAAPGCFAH